MERSLNKAEQSVACIALVVALAVLGGTEDSGSRTELAEMEARLATHYVVNELRLRPPQKAQLLEIRHEIAPAAAEYLDKRRAWRKSTERAVRDYVDYSTRTGEFPPDSIQDELLWDYLVARENTRRHFRERIGPLADRFGQSLDDRQKKRLKELEAAKWGVPGLYYVFPGLPTESEEDPDLPEAVHLSAVTQRILSGSLSRVGYLCAAPYLEEALGIRETDFPHWWDMGEELRESKRNAVTHKLTVLTGLNLTPEQLDRLAKAMRKSLPRVGLMPWYGEDLRTREGRAYAKQLKRSAKHLRRGRAPSPEVMQELGRARCLWLNTQQKRTATPEGKERCEEATAELCRNVREILSASQFARLTLISSCQVPLRDMRGTARAGEVAADWVEKVAAILDAARRREDWDSPKGNAWWREHVMVFVGGPGNYSRMTKEEQQEVYTRATALVVRARKMTDVDYLSARNRMGRQLATLKFCESLYVASPKDDSKIDEAAAEGLVLRIFVKDGYVLLPLIEARLEHCGKSRRGK